MKSDQRNKEKTLTGTHSERKSLSIDTTRFEDGMKPGISSNDNKIRSLLQSNDIKGLLAQEIFTNYNDSGRYSSQRINLQSMLRLKIQH